MELSIFCFQALLTVYSITLLSYFFGIFRLRSGLVNSMAFYACLASIMVSLAYLYYANITVLLEIRDMKDDMTKEEIEAPTQSYFILISFYTLTFIANFIWCVMNFSLGFITSGIIVNMNSIWRQER